MKVVNSLGDNFKVDCKNLAAQIIERYQPDLVVGIYSGGMIVGQQVFTTQLFSDAILIDVRAQRPSTKQKKKINLEFILAYFPMWLCNLLRILEVKYQINRFNPNHFTERTVIVSDHNKTLIQQAKKILVIDDAVDSGVTLFSVLKVLNQINPRAELKSAALTVTFPQPLIEPDFYLYKGTLLRFPWAADAKGR